MKKPFYELTNIGRARRLRNMAIAALDYYDLDVADIRLITNDFNGIFRIQTKDNNKYVLRIGLPQGGHDIQSYRSEIEWLQALNQDTQLCVPTPIRAKNGDHVVTVRTEGVPEPRHCMIFTWIRGHMLANELSLKNVCLLGKLSAELHQQASTFVPSRQFKILRFDKVFPFPEPIILFDKEYAAFFSGEQEKIFRKGVEWAQNIINDLKKSKVPMIVLHGDLHQWNVHIFRGKLSPIDFEDLMWGWPVQDIATSLYYFIGMKNYLDLKSAFIDGYTQILSWPEQSVGQVDAFIAARGIGLVNFVLQDPNPDWQADAGNFIATTEKRLRALLSANHIGW